MFLLVAAFNFFFLFCRLLCLPINYSKVDNYLELGDYLIIPNHRQVVSEQLVLPEIVSLSIIAHLFH